MNINFKKYLLQTTSSLDCKETEVIQSLWSGYGKISRYTLDNAQYDTVVVKNISLNHNQEHPRGWNTNIGHQRKVKSYEVETSWYQQYTQDCTEASRIPQFLGSFSEGSNQYIIMEDLDTHFPVRKQSLAQEEIKVCLKWLAHFHATFMNGKPKDLWEIGTYWHLATRPDEFKKIEHPKLKANAHMIDKTLNNCKYKTFVHGDAKLANFCFSVDGREVSGVDFQYVGGGCGMKDVAYFMGSCLSGDQLARQEDELLRYYFYELRMALSKWSKENFEDLEKEWRYLYPFACADFTRFLLGWMPEHQKINEYQLQQLEKVLRSLKES